MAQMTVEQRQYLMDLARRLGMADESAALRQAGQPVYETTVEQASAAIDWAREQVAERAERKAAEIEAAAKAAPTTTVRVIVPARGNDLRAPSSSKGFGRWRWVLPGQRAGEGWSSAKYEGPAKSGQIEIQSSLRRSSGKMDVSVKAFAVAPGRYAHGVPQPYEIQIETVETVE